MAKYYAVKSGRETGIFNTWEECKLRVDSFSGAIYKSFKTLKEAQEYLGVSFKEKSQEKDFKPTYKVYVDGSYREKSNKCTWAYVIYKDNKEIHHDNGIMPVKDMLSMRNVAGEIYAAVKAVMYLNEHNLKAVIYHDYQGVSSWVDGSWKTKNEWTKKYSTFMKNYINKVFKFSKVTGHSGIKGNERADQLCSAAY